MGLKTQTHTGQANPNIKAQENTLSAKPLSPFKPKGTVKQSQTNPVPQTQTKEPQLLSPSREQTLSPSRRQFIEQYGAYALVTPVALYAMMSPNRAMAQAGSVGVIDDRPRILLNNERIENFDIDTHIDGIIEEDGDLELLHDEKYIAPDGVTYTCNSNDGCYITPTAGGGGYSSWGSIFSITYPDDIGSSDQATDDVAAADVVVVVITDGYVVPNFDISRRTDGYIDQGELVLNRNQKYIGVDGKHYTCVANFCFIAEDDGYVYEL